MAKKRRWFDFWPVLLLLGVTAFVFREAIFPPYPSWVLSRESGDVSTIYYYWRSYGFGMLKAGIIPLWNPAIFCGTPFAAYPESALFYPANLIFLILPVPAALNGSFLIHIAALLLFQFFWLRSIGSGRWPALLGSVALGFSGPVILHLAGGHLSNICTMAWVPLLFLLAERFLRTRRPVWAGALGFCLGLQLLAGHWQYVYYGALWLAAYAVGRVIIEFKSWKGTWRNLAGGLLLCLVVAAGLAAVQILPALEVSRDSFRRGLDIGWASDFSLPPKNLVTFLLPGYLGDTLSSLYRGRYYFWEMCGYLGFIPLVLALLALLFRKDRMTPLLAVLAGGALIIALGAYTPLFRGLYHFLPGFRYFRGSAKSLFMVAFFLSTLAARGLDCFSASGEKSGAPVFRFTPTVRRTVAGTLAGLVLLVALGSFVFLVASGASPPGWWRAELQSDLLRGRHYDIVPPGQPAWWRRLMRETPPDRDYPGYVRRLVEETPFPENSWRTLRSGVYRLGWSSLAFACLLGSAAFSRRRHPAIPAVIAILAAVELITWSGPYVTGFDSRVCLWNEKIGSFFEEQREPFRYLALDPADYNRGMLRGFASVLGYQADATRRYLEYINASQGLPLRARDLVPMVTNYSPLLDLLNTRFVLAPAGMLADVPWFRESVSTGETSVWRNNRSHARALISSRARVITSQNEILSALNRSEYRPEEEIILEKAPPAPFLEGGGRGSARVVEYGPEEVIVQVELNRPGILLLNDSYSPGWKAYVDGEEREIYRANYLMRAVCLEVGLHSVRFAYRPASFTIGALISSTVLVISVLAALFGFRGRRRVISVE